MVLTKDVYLPSEEETKVPHEITLSTPWFKSVAPYMARTCETQIKVRLFRDSVFSYPYVIFKDFMLRRKEAEDPRKTLKEGAAVTACGIDFLKALKKNCAKETERLAHCIDYGSRDLYLAYCHEEQRTLDQCVEEKMNIVRPAVGYFAKLHVHDLSDAPPGWPFHI